MSQTKAQLLDPKGDVTYSGHITGVGATFNGNIRAVDGIFSGNVSIAGTLTKQDVTNVDSVGLITARAGIRFSTTASYLGADTSDASDNKYLAITGGGAVSQSRGASVVLYGNEESNFPGQLSILAGNVGSAPIKFYTGGTERVRIDSSGNTSIGNVTAAPTSSAYNAGTLHIHQATGGASGGSQIKMTTTQSGSAAGDGAYLAYYGNNELYIYNRENADISFGTNATERLRITSQGSVGINSTSPVGTLDVATTVGTASTVFIYAANHNTSAASEAELRFGFGHSGSPEGIGYIKLKENGTNVFDGNLIFGVPTNNGSGGSVTNDVLTIKGSSQSVGIGTNIPIKKFDVRGTGNQGILIGSYDNSGAQLIIDGSGNGDGGGGNYGAIEHKSNGDLTIRNHDASQSIILGAGSAAGGNDSLVINSSQTATFAGAVVDYKGNVRSVPLNTQASTYTLIATDAGKAILASNTITINDGIFGPGDVVTIINNTNGDIAINKGSVLYNTADGTNGNRTLATRGIATIYFTHNTTGYISGTGLS